MEVESSTRAQHRLNLGHSMRGSIVSLLVTIQTAACAARTAPAANQSTLCQVDVLSGAHAATSEMIDSLAGAYALVLVNTVTSWIPLGPREATLELWFNASSRRPGWPRQTLGRLPGPRPLVGRVRLAVSGGSPASELAAVPGSDHPDVEVVGTDLYFGAPDATDASGHVLRITHMSRDGFWGTWSFDLGIGSVVDSATGRRLEDPAGYFCAVRRP